MQYQSKHSPRQEKEHATRQNLNTGILNIEISNALQIATWPSHLTRQSKPVTS